MASRKCASSREPLRDVNVPVVGVEAFKVAGLDPSTDAITEQESLSCR